MEDDVKTQNQPVSLRASGIQITKRPSTTSPLLAIGMESPETTFVAALRSVGTAATMAMAGFYLHRRKLITPEAKKGLAKISQQVTIPALFFSKIISCPKDQSDEPCPNIAENISNVWVLALWPLYVVGCGLLVGELVARLSGTPKKQRRSVVAACAFANSTGLPVTLLTVIHANIPETTEIGRVDPNLFLSVYLLLYPALQWGIGGWLLAAPESDTISDRSKHGIVPHVLNSRDAESNCALTDLEKSSIEKEGLLKYEEPPADPEENEEFNGIEEAEAQPMNEAPLNATISKVLSKALQPPVIGALLGLFIASFPPLRGLFVDFQMKSGGAPLEWFFDGIYAIGRAAVPLNMSILGINLSMTSQSRDTSNSISSRTVAAVVIGRMILMPLIGILTVVCLKNYAWNIPPEIDGPFYLVMMIVTITPTANNVMVMVELSGSGSGKNEEVARIIAWQYVLAPILLSITVTIVVRITYLW